MKDIGKFLMWIFLFYGFQDLILFHIVKKELIYKIINQIDDAKLIFSNFSWTYNILTIKGQYFEIPHMLFSSYLALIAKQDQNDNTYIRLFCIVSKFTLFRLGILIYY